MGNGKKMKCNDCGNEWLLLYGMGIDAQQPTDTESHDEEQDNVCPECGSTNTEEEQGTAILWD